MKVLHLVTKTRPFFANQVAALEEHGVDQTVIEVPGKESAADQRSLIDYAKYYPNVLSKINSDYDIIHANFGLTIPFALAQPVRPVVTTLWGSDLMGKYGTVTRQLARLCNEVVLPSSAMGSYYPYEHTILPFGIDSNLFRPIPKSDARELVGWETNKNIIIFPYNPSREVKNFDLAQQVIGQVENTEIRPVYGVPHDLMPLYMNASDCLLITSKRESGPMVVKESVMCNTPVVARNVGFVEEVLSGVSTAHVCDSVDGLVDGVEQALGYESVESRRHIVEDNNLSHMGEELYNLYTNIRA